MDDEVRFRRFLRGWAFLVVTAAGAAMGISWSALSHASSSAPGAANLQVSTRKSSKPKPALPPPKEAPVPFRAGELLKYNVSWASFATAATVELAVPERRDFYGWQTWHL